jgi:hypothetical protein
MVTNLEKLFIQEVAGRKFRIWDSENRWMIYPKPSVMVGYEVKPPVVMINPFDGMVYHPQAGCLLPNLIPLASTTLLDRDGTTIYFGDIIYRESTEEHFLIQFSLIQGMSFFNAYRTFSPVLKYPLDKPQGDLKVVGNIFEQPELEDKLLNSFKTTGDEIDGY